MAVFLMICAYWLRVKDVCQFLPDYKRLQF